MYKNIKAVYKYMTILVKNTMGENVSIFKPQAERAIDCCPFCGYAKIRRSKRKHLYLCMRCEENFKVPAKKRHKTKTSPKLMPKYIKSNFEEIEA